MEISKIGKVVFEGGDIVSIEDFEVKGGSPDDLRRWVSERFVFVKGDAAQAEQAAECGRLRAEVERLRVEEEDWRDAAIHFKEKTGQAERERDQAIQCAAELTKLNMQAAEVEKLRIERDLLKTLVENFPDKNFNALWARTCKSEAKLERAERERDKLRSDLEEIADQHRWLFGYEKGAPIDLVDFIRDDTLQLQKRAEDAERNCDEMKAQIVVKDEVLRKAKESIRISLLDFDISHSSTCLALPESQYAADCSHPQCAALREIDTALNPETRASAEPLNEMCECGKPRKHVGYCIGKARRRTTGGS